MTQRCCRCCCCCRFSNNSRYFNRQMPESKLCRSDSLVVHRRRCILRRLLPFLPCSSGRDRSEDGSNQLIAFRNQKTGNRSAGNSKKTKKDKRETGRYIGRTNRAMAPPHLPEISSQFLSLKGGMGFRSNHIDDRLHTLIQHCPQPLCIL